MKLIKKLNDINFETLPELSDSERIGSCIANPSNFFAIGLNYSDHAAESGMDAPSEPIVFMKATSSINGPNDDIEISKDSKKLDWEVELGIIIGKDAKNIKKQSSRSYFRILFGK